MTALLSNINKKVQLKESVDVNTKSLRLVKTILNMTNDSSSRKNVTKLEFRLKTVD